MRFFVFVLLVVLSGCSATSSAPVRDADALERRLREQAFTVRPASVTVEGLAAQMPGAQRRSYMIAGGRNLTVTTTTVTAEPSGRLPAPRPPAPPEAARIDVYTFATDADAEEALEQIRQAPRDADEIFAQGRLVVVMTGENRSLVTALTREFGRPVR